MSFRESSGRETCNTCRRVVDLGAPLYVGQHTPSFWCADCAATVLGVSVSGPVPKVRPGPMRDFDAKAMGAELRKRIEARRRTVTIGGEE